MNAGAPDVDTERRLIEAAQRGDRESFDRLIALQLGLVYGLSWRFLRNREDAEDNVQEVFIRLWRQLDRFDFRCRLSTWIYRITVNACLDRLRMEARRGKTGNGWEPSSAIPHPEEALIRRDAADLIEALACRLPPRQREVFVLRDLQDESPDEVARILGISLGNVKSTLSQARRQLRLWLEEHERGGTAP